MDLRKGASPAERLAMVAENLGVTFDPAPQRVYHAIRGQFGHVRAYEREFNAENIRLVS